MDRRLFERLEKIEQSIEELRAIEKQSLDFDAHEDVLFAQLFLKTEGKNIAEREAKVHASKDWQDFVKGHVEAKSAYNEARRRYELRLKAYDSEHITYKVENTAIARQVG